MNIIDLFHQFGGKGQTGLVLPANKKLTKRRWPLGKHPLMHHDPTPVSSDISPPTDQEDQSLDSKPILSIIKDESGELQELDLCNEASNIKTILIFLLTFTLISTGWYSILYITKIKKLDQLGISKYISHDDIVYISNLFNHILLVLLLNMYTIYQADDRCGISITIGIYIILSIIIGLIKYISNPETQYIVFSGILTLIIGIGIIWKWKYGNKYSSDLPCPTNPIGCTSFIIFILICLIWIPLILKKQNIINIILSEKYIENHNSLLFHYSACIVIYLYYLLLYNSKYSIASSMPCRDKIQVNKNTCINRSLTTKMITHFIPILLLVAFGYSIYYMKRNCEPPNCTNKPIVDFIKLWKFIKDNLYLIIPFYIILGAIFSGIIYILVKKELIISKYLPLLILGCVICAIIYSILLVFFIIKKEKIDNIIDIEFFEKNYIFIILYTFFPLLSMLLYWAVISRANHQNIQKNIQILTLTIIGCFIFAYYVTVQVKKQINQNINTTNMTFKMIYNLDIENKNQVCITNIINKYSHYILLGITIVFSLICILLYYYTGIVILMVILTLLKQIFAFVNPGRAIKNIFILFTLPRLFIEALVVGLQFQINKICDPKLPQPTINYDKSNETVTITTGDITDSNINYILLNADGVNTNIEISIDHDDKDNNISILNKSHKYTRSTILNISNSEINKIKAIQYTVDDSGNPKNKSLPAELSI